jgi:hypothetical protein
MFRDGRHDAGRESDLDMRAIGCAQDVALRMFDRRDQLLAAMNI